MLIRADILAFRSCSDTVVELDQSLVALIGPNGVGKSNILRAVEWVARGGTAVRAVHRPARGLRSSTALPHVVLSLRLDGVVYQYTLGMRPSAHLGGRPFDVEEELRVAGSLLFSRRAETLLLFPRTAEEQSLRLGTDASALSVLISFLPNEHSAMSHLSSVHQFLSSIRYYALEAPPSGTSYVRESRFREWREEFEGQGEPRDSVLMRLIYLYEKRREDYEELCHLIGPDGLNLVNQVSVVKLEREMPYRPPGDIRLQLRPEPVFAVLFEPAAYQGGSGQSFAFDDLSAGTRRVIQLVTSMLFDLRAVMLIEQPEDSVHFGLMHKLVDVIRGYSSRTQVVFSTHARDMLDMLTPEEVRIVYTESGATRVASLSSAEVAAARQYTSDAGALSEFLDSLNER